jgi:hypothetical protein
MPRPESHAQKTQLSAKQRAACTERVAGEWSGPRPAESTQLMPLSGAFMPMLPRPSRLMVCRGAPGSMAWLTAGAARGAS